MGNVIQTQSLANGQKAQTTKSAQLVLEAHSAEAKQMAS